MIVGKVWGEIEIGIDKPLRMDIVFIIVSTLRPLSHLIPKLSRQCPLQTFNWDWDDWVGGVGVGGVVGSEWLIFIT